MPHFAGRLTTLACRVRFWRCLAALHRVPDAPHRAVRCALPNDTPKTNKIDHIKGKVLYQFDCDVAAAPDGGGAGFVMGQVVPEVGLAMACGHYLPERTGLFGVSALFYRLCAKPAGKWGQDSGHSGGVDSGQSLPTVVIAVLWALLITVTQVMAGGQAAYAATCPAVTPPKIAFDFEPKSPQLDRHRSVRWLNRQHAHNANWFVTGLTSYAMQARFEMRIEPVALANGRYCLQPAIIHPTVSVTEHLVYIASELTKGSCEYDVVYAHEGQHVAINQHMELDIRKALPDFLHQVTDDFDRMSPMSAQMASSRIRSLFSKYGLEFKALLAKIDARRQRDHAKIDTAKEYRRLSHACGPNSAFQTTLPAAMRPALKPGP